MKPSLLIALLVASVAAVAQQTTVTHSGSARASCLANTGSISNVQLVCKGLSREDAEMLAEMLNNKMSGDIHQMMQQMQQILQQQQQINATLSGQSFGNLKERANQFAQEVARWVNFILMTDPSKRVNNQADREAIKEEYENWYYDNLSEFDHTFWQNVLKLRGEFAAHNFHDEDLDQIVDEVERRRQTNLLLAETKRRNPDIRALQNQRLVNGPNMPQIREIANAFSHLASELPDQPQSPPAR